MPKTPFSPRWKEFEEKANNPHDAQAALKASDAFEEVRDQEMKTSKQARDWEFDRKKEWVKNKPKYVKDRIKSEQDAIMSPLKRLKIGGSFEGHIKPMPGYFILEVIKKVTSESGIVLPDQEDQNTGTVVEISEAIIYRDKRIICPVKVGDKVLFKRGAGTFGAPGLELTIEGKEYRMMRWHHEPSQSDLLGVFYD